jgi:histidinol-phosphate/aromatic aminotransferase/cobyric acid decarboxylase-like protein
MQLVRGVVNWESSDVYSRSNVSKVVGLKGARVGWCLAKAEAQWGGF